MIDSRKGYKKLIWLQDIKKSFYFRDYTLQRHEVLNYLKSIGQDIFSVPEFASWADKIADLMLY